MQDSFITKVCIDYVLHSLQRQITQQGWHVYLCFAFAFGSDNHPSAHTLRRLLKEDGISWYGNFEDIETSDQRNGNDVYYSVLNVNMRRHAWLSKNAVRGA